MSENKRPFAVTGENFGALVYAKSKAEAEVTFCLYYAGEKVLNIRDCENEPFEIKED